MNKSAAEDFARLKAESPAADFQISVLIIPDPSVFVRFPAGLKFTAVLQLPL